MLLSSRVSRLKLAPSVLRSISQKSECGPPEAQSSRIWDGEGVDQDRVGRGGAGAVLGQDVEGIVGIGSETGGAGGGGAGGRGGQRGEAAAGRHGFHFEVQLVVALVLPDQLHLAR